MDQPRKTVIIRKKTVSGVFAPPSAQPQRMPTKVPTVRDPEPDPAAAKADSKSIATQPGGIEADRVNELLCAQCQKVLDVAHLPSFSEIKCPDCGTSQIVPAKFGGFLLLGKIGAGGMGMIYKAMDRELGRFVAMKVMKKSLGDNEEFIQSFKHEAQAAAALNHPNVVQIYSFGQFHGQPYIVMELMLGGRLDKMIEGGQKLEELKALIIHFQVAQGLKAAADAGLLHGDVKPANVLFGQQREAKVLDFGLASIIGQEQKSGQIWGTPYYIAPEKARGQKVDARSDIYSLGATLFHVLAGQPPFDGQTPADVVMARLKNPAPSLTLFRQDLHPDTLRLVAKMLEADPTRRYKTNTELLTDMRATVDTVRRPAKISATQNIKKQLAQIPRKTWRKIAIGSAAALLLVGGITGYTLHTQHEKQRAEAKAFRDKVAAAEEGARGYLAKDAQLAGIIRQAVLDMKTADDQAAEAQAFLIQFRQTVDSNAIPANMNLDRELGRVQKTLDAVSASVEKGLGALEETEYLQQLGQAIAVTMGKATNAKVSSNVFTLMKTQAWGPPKTSRPLDVIQTLTNMLAVTPKFLEDYRRKTLDFRMSAQDNILDATNALAGIVGKIEQRRKENERIKQILDKETRDKELAIQKAREEKERLKIAIQQELDALDETRGKNAELIAQRKFDDAGGMLARLRPKTDEGKAALKRVQDTYAYLAKLKDFLIKSINAAKFEGGWVMGGKPRDIIQATTKGFTATLDQGSTATVEWDKVPTPQLMKLAEYYLKGKAVTDREKAGLHLGLALLCYESADAKAVEAYMKQAEAQATQACQLDASIRAEVTRLMPGLLGE